jgi:sialidase-1
MASMVRLTSRPNHDRNRLLFSNPHNLERLDGKAEPGKNRDRRNLTVKLSYDESETWPVQKTIEPGWSGYSDLAVANDGTILCFYERGGLDANHFKTAALTLARFDLEWLTDGSDRLRPAKKS